MIRFDDAGWRRVREHYAAWWNQTSAAPILGVTVFNEPKTQPDLPLVSQATATDFSVSPEQIIDRIDFELSCYDYYGDAYPRFQFDCYGPGVLAAFLGAVVDNRTGRVWFHDETDFDYGADLVLDFDSPYFLRLSELFRIAGEKWQGKVAVGMADLGGIADVLYTFRSGEKLLFDLYDRREEVQHQLEVIGGLWQKAFDRLYAQCKCNAGYTDWSSLLSDTPSYVIQCDFAYMVGNEDFDEILLPEIAKQCRTLDRTIYHLDGVGQLRHLDSLLGIRELNAVQWIYGDGQNGADAPEWLEVYDRILAAGKSVQLAWCGLDEYRNVMNRVKKPNLVNRPLLGFHERDRDAALRLLDEFGVER